jgi:hypothetical protein
MLEIILVAIMGISVMHMLDSISKSAVGYYNNDKDFLIRFSIGVLLFVISVAGIITINVI